MSADNGYIVTFLEDQPNKVGIFYYSASAEYPLSYYTEENAQEVFDSPIKAIVRAHEIEKDHWTEYGISVHSLVTIAAGKELG